MTNVKIDKFRRFGFTNTTYITGNYKKLGFNDKRLIKDSNFNFKTDSFSVSSLDDMFNGCENASFTHSLTLSSNHQITSADRMFYGCKYASLPSIDIENSNLISCESMFEGCANAKLNGVKIPKNAANVSKMFKGCSTASLDAIGTLPEEITDYTEMFNGCSNSVLRRIRMPKPSESRRYVFSYMFYGCENMDSDNLYFEDISEYARQTEYMFYGAGNYGSESFDSSVLNFGKLKSCDSMFNSSRFSFVKTYLQFFAKNMNHGTPGYTSETSVDSIRRMFYGTTGITDMAPVVVLGNCDTNNVEQIESILSGAIDGHYTVVDGLLTNGITDFSESYAYSNAKSVDLRGICNNNTLYSVSDDKYSYGIQNFTSMFEGCENLEIVKGYIPPYGYTYKNMFNGCRKLELDLSKMFRKHYKGWSGSDTLLEMDGASGTEFASYSMTSIGGMFYGCDKLYSSSDSFDLVGLVKTVYNNVIDSEQSNKLSECMNSVFAPLRIATKNPIYGLANVDYDISSISKDYGIIRYNSFEDDQYDLENGSISEFGVYSKFMKYLFGDGFYRFGGFFNDDQSRFFCIINHPVLDETTGEVTSFYNQSLNYSPLIVPHNFSKKFNTKKSEGYWNEYTFNNVYAAKIYDSTNGEFLNNAFVGSYTRIYHENKLVGDDMITVTSQIEMPVTWFDIYDDDIIISEL